MTLSVNQAGVEAFAAANTSAAELISSAGSADAAAHLAAAAAALGPVGAAYMAAYAPAQTNNLSAALMVGGVHAAVAGATTSALQSFTATDTA